MSIAQQIDRALMALIAAVLAASVVIAFVSPTYFSQVFAAEDQLVEYGTALGLLIASGVLLRHAMSLSASGRRAAAAFTLVYALMFFLASGEEVSWGQRIFGWESGEFFQENNKQDETNFHNLVVGDFHLAKTLFGPVLTLCILLYLVALPILYRQGGRIAALADRMAVPVPWLRHGIIALIASIIIAVLDVNRRWEVYELIFSILSVAIFVLPQNKSKVS
ncbi:hypothetical protein O4H61_07125 [Roseovarius aestuarii]|nr:hypothetical protein [Roseovarius aestuarii]